MPERAPLPLLESFAFRRLVVGRSRRPGLGLPALYSALIDRMQCIDKDDRLAQRQAGIASPGIELAQEFRLIGYHKADPADPCRQRRAGEGVICQTLARQPTSHTFSVMRHGVHRLSETPHGDPPQGADGSPVSMARAHSRASRCR
jgi:hypothetical protein